jgi:hypothetical protein
MVSPYIPRLPTNVAYKAAYNTYCNPFPGRRMLVLRPPGFVPNEDLW